ncbi:MAG TPA: DNA polymerase III subunit delta' [Candidatus Limnocylindria bacterium]|nr:DNA polymerase III subunit delta' [Candidatus Limnocylindria bacterium]
MGHYLTRGQPSALSLVRRAVETERPPHALLLVGPSGVGKTTLAMDLAAGLLCLATDSADRPCGECAACRKVAHGNHPDLHRIAPEGAGQQIRVAQVQALASDLALLPLEGRFRVAIIENAQRMNIDAQNALLKTLEEPPARVALILAADDSAALLPTVVSRCARARLGPVPGEPIAELLAERGLADSSRAASLARLASGRPGVALALATQPEATVVQSRLAAALLDLLGADRRRRLAAPPEMLADAAELLRATYGRAGDDEAPARRSSGSATKVSPAERRAAAGQLLAVWRDVARDLAVATRGGKRELRQHELLDDLARAGTSVDPDAAARFLDRLEAVSRALDAYANPELALDALLLAWPRARRAA